MKKRWSADKIGVSPSFVVEVEVEKKNFVVYSGGLKSVWAPYVSLKEGSDLKTRRGGSSPGIPSFDIARVMVHDGIYGS